MIGDVTSPGTGFGNPDGWATRRRPATADGGLGMERPPELRDVRRFSHEAMATVFEVYCVHRDPSYAAQAAQAAFDLVDQLERELSRFIPNSDIGRINSLQVGGSTLVTPSTIECLLIARHMYDLTGGAFDIAVGTGLESLELDPGACRVRATGAGTQVDLGGIGKGYAVDRMAETLEEWGIVGSLVHGGFSSVLALEPPPGRDGWPLTLSDPAAPSQVLARLSVRQTALGASGLRKGDHIVDPRTGEPVRGRRAAWLVLPRPEDYAAGLDGDTQGAECLPPRAHRLAAGAVTDALTTACMLLRLDEIEALCERSPGLGAWILPELRNGPPGPPDLIHFGA